MLRAIFDLDNPLMRFLSKVADLLALNLLFLLCSIPIFTIGASLTAMYYCFFKMKDQEEGYLAKRFFKSFKENFKQATLMWLIMLLLFALLFFEFLMFRTTPGTSGTVIRAIILMGLIFWFLKHNREYLPECGSSDLRKRAPLDRHRSSDRADGRHYGVPDQCHRVLEPAAVLDPAGIFDRCHGQRRVDVSGL